MPTLLSALERIPFVRDRLKVGTIASLQGTSGSIAAEVIRRGPWSLDAAVSEHALGLGLSRNITSNLDIGVFAMDEFGGGLKPYLGVGLHRSF